MSLLPIAFIDPSTILNVLLLVLGFGFVIFWHELGHFLAAKWAGIKVEQFAVGFGHAMVSYRKGVGFCFGSTQRRLAEIVAQAEAQGRRIEPGMIGETEYRISWIPMGGYVKMLGQEDMDPAKRSEDPRAYTSKSIGARMIVISAGVIMNIILAAVLFMGLFLWGYNVPPAVVGSVMPGSPAQQATLASDPNVRAPLEVGDRILSIDGTVTNDFKKVALNTALGSGAQPLRINVRRVNGKEEMLLVKATRVDPPGMLVMGVGPILTLRAYPSAHDIVGELENARPLLPPQTLAVMPGEAIVALEGRELNPDSAADYAAFDAALQAARGRPINVTVAAADGTRRVVPIRGVPVPSFGGTADGIPIAGMIPRVAVAQVSRKSPVEKLLKPGDVITSFSRGLGDYRTDTHLSPEELRRQLAKAGELGQKITLGIRRDGVDMTFADIDVNYDLGSGRKGLGVALKSDPGMPVVGGVNAGSSAETAGITPGSTILRVGGVAVESWPDVMTALAGLKPGNVVLDIRTPAGEAKSASLAFSGDDLALLKSIRFDAGLALLAPAEEIRRTSSPLTAAAWGITETRDAVLQFYVTLRRLAEGSVSTKNLMGPVGMFDAGIRIAQRESGAWLVWYFALISANLAVVNFLPIPIVDGGHFLLLILEKIRGKPLSARATNATFGAGLIFLLLVFVYVTFNDISRIFF